MGEVKWNRTGNVRDLSNCILVICEEGDDQVAERIWRELHRSFAPNLTGEEVNKLGDSTGFLRLVYWFRIKGGEEATQEETIIKSMVPKDQPLGAGKTLLVRMPPDPERVPCLVDNRQWKSTPDRQEEVNRWIDSNHIIRTPQTSNPMGFELSEASQKPPEEPELKRGSFRL